MQSGSVNQPPRKSHIQRKPPLNETSSNKEAAANAEAVAEQESQPAEVLDSNVPQPEVPSGDQKMPFAGVTDITIDDLALKPDGKGGFQSSKTFALVDKDKRAELEAQGAIFPEWRNETLGDGVGAGGDLGVAAVYGTMEPGKARVAKGALVDEKLTEIDPTTNKPYHANLDAVVLDKGERVINAEWKAVLADTDESEKTESRRVLVNNITKGLGTFSGSSLAGIMRLPVITTYAPLLALGTSGFSFNSNMEARRDNKRLLGQLDSAQSTALKSGKGDLVELESADGAKFTVSGKAERSRLNTQVRQATMQLGSTGLLGLAGLSSIVGGLASAGVAGYAGMAAAGAATPFLAGGALVLGNGGMVFNALSQLNELKAERNQLLKLQEQGQTHVDRVLEVASNTQVPVSVSDRLGEIIAKQSLGGLTDEQLEQLDAQKESLQHLQAKGQTHFTEMLNPNIAPRLISRHDKPVSVPITERLKEIEKDQRKQRLMATALSGGMVSIGGSITGLASMSLLGPLAIAPAGLLAVGQSRNQLRVLGKEKKELKALAAEGQTMVERPLQQSDGTWKEERIPISTLLSENKKEVNKHKMILTGVGSVGAMMGATLGAGLSIWAAAPLALIPLAIGAALFPDKVKAFAGMVGDLVGGVLGDAGQTKRATKKANEKKFEDFSKRIDEKLSGLEEGQPGSLFGERSRHIGAKMKQDVGWNPLAAAAQVGSLFKKEFGGYYTEMKNLAQSYAESDEVGYAQEDAEGNITGSGRAYHMARINDAMSKAPDDAKPGLGIFVDELKNLQMEVEASWLARDIALEMVTPTTQKVVTDDRVKARLGELEFDTDYDSVREQYEESLHIENSQDKQAEIMEKSQQGDREATLKLSRVEVFRAARVLATQERALGNKLFTRYMDAIKQPENEENLELLMKEVGYKQKRALSGNDIQVALNSLNTLSEPIQIQPSEGVVLVKGAVAQLREADPDATSQLLKAEATLADPNAFDGMSAKKALAERTRLNGDIESASKILEEKDPGSLALWNGADQKTKSRATSERPPAMSLEGPEARMQNAFRGLSTAQPKLAKQLGDAFAVLNTSGTFEGMDAQQTQHAKVAAKVKLDKIRGKLDKKEPELMELWDNAREEVSQTHFDRSVDHKFKARVLANETVVDAAKNFELSEDEVEGLYMGLMKSQILHDPRDLQARLADETGEAADPNKAEMLAVIDRAMLRTVAEATDGGADFVAPDPEQSPLEDPAVINLLQQQPQIGQVLGSAQFLQLAESMQLPPDEVRDAYLTIVQAELNPARLAEFQGLVAAGDMETVKTMQVGQAVVGLISQMTRPDPEVVKQQLEVSMEGAVAQAVLGHPDVTGQAEALGVDAESTMRMLIKAEISRDPAELAALEQRAEKGDTAARNQLQLLQTLSQGIQHFSQLAQQQMEHPPAA